MTDVTVSSSSALLSAIQEYGAGDVIHSTDGRRANPSSGTTLDGEGVTVVCDRPVSHLIRVRSSDVEIRNIRFIGPRYEEVVNNGWWDYEVSGEAWNFSAEAIGLYDDTLVEHCEFSGWTHAGIQVGSNNDGGYEPTIRANRFVDNNCRALGYGIVVQGGNALIENNYFQNNRHDVAGGDWEGVSYEARYNHVGDTGRIYGMEAHPPGGRWIHIHNNTFEDKYGNYGGKGTGRRKLIRNRGTPSEGALVENNWFKGEMVTDVNGGYTFRNNHEGASTPPDGVGRPSDLPTPGIGGDDGDSVPEPRFPFETRRVYNALTRMTDSFGAIATGRFR